MFIKEFVNDNLSFVDEGVYDPHIFKAVFMAGGPGSGKSYVAQKLLGSTGLRQINSDKLYELLAKKRDLDLSDPEQIFSPGGQDARNKAKEITKRQQDTFLDGRLGLVIDATGRDYSLIQRQYAMLKNLGYDCYMVFVNTSLDVAIQRNKTRSRSIPEYIVTKSWQGVQSNMGAFQRMFSPNKMLIVDNNKDDKELVTQTLNTASRFIRSRLRTKPENSIAMSWIKKELELKRR